MSLNKEEHDHLASEVLGAEKRMETKKGPEQEGAESQEQLSKLQGTLEELGKTIKALEADIAVLQAEDVDEASVDPEVLKDDLAQLDRAIEELTAKEAEREAILAEMAELKAITDAAPLESLSTEESAKEEPVAEVSIESTQDASIPEASTEPTVETIAGTHEPTTEELSKQLAQEMAEVLPALNKEVAKLQGRKVRDALQREIELNLESLKQETDEPGAYHVNMFMREPRVDYYLSQVGEEAAEEVRKNLSRDAWKLSVAEIERRQAAGYYKNTDTALYDRRTFDALVDARSKNESPAKLKEYEKRRADRKKEFGDAYEEFYQRDLTDLPIGTIKNEEVLTAALRTAIVGDRAWVKQNFPDKDPGKTGLRSAYEAWSKQEEAIRKETADKLMQDGLRALRLYEQEEQRARETPEYQNDKGVIEAIKSQHGEALRRIEALRDKLSNTWRDKARQVATSQQQAA